MDLARTAAGADGLADIRVIDRYDRYYIDRHHKKPLPVILAVGGTLGVLFDQVSTARRRGDQHHSGLGARLAQRLEGGAHARESNQSGPVPRSCSAA